MAEEFRAKVWRSRTRSSRPVGVVLFIISGGFFLLAFVTSSLLAEVSSLAAFVLGALLLVTNFEPRVGIFPSAEAIEGPVKATVTLLKERGWSGSAEFVVTDGGVKMMQGHEKSPSFYPFEVSPYGHDLLEYYESEAGKLSGKGIEFAREWLPRVLRDASGLVESVSIRNEKGQILTDLVRPFVRPLCVKPFFTENVCNSIGCPLVNSIGEAFALANGKKISHAGCRYDPLTQTAHAVHVISES